MDGELIHTENDPDDAIPKGKMEKVFEQVEMMALRKSNTVDINALNDTQKDTLLQVMKQNEDHAFEYHTKKLDTDKEIKLAQIKARTITQISHKNSTLSVIVACFVITLCILFFKDQYLVGWLSFITGIIGGYGLGKIPRPDKEQKIAS